MIWDETGRSITNDRHTKGRRKSILAQNADSGEPLHASSGFADCRGEFAIRPQKRIASTNAGRSMFEGLPHSPPPPASANRRCEISNGKISSAGSSIGSGSGSALKKRGSPANPWRAKTSVPRSWTRPATWFASRARWPAMPRAAWSSEAGPGTSAGSRRKPASHGMRPSTSSRRMWTPGRRRAADGDASGPGAK